MAKKICPPDTKAEIETIDAECGYGAPDCPPAETPPVVIDSSCEAPVHVEICPPEEPIPVLITNPTPDVEKVEYCNPATDTMWVKVCNYAFDAEGVATESVLSDDDTGIACSDWNPSVDVEKQETCNTDTGTTWYRVCRYITDADGNTVEEVVTNWTDTEIPCAKADVEVLGTQDYCISGEGAAAVGAFDNEAAFLSSLNVDTQGSELFAGVTAGSYPSIVVPSGEWFHYDYNAAGLFAGTQRTIVAENPISQNGASLPQMGVETVGGGTTSQNSIIHCLASPVGFWGADILDMESNPAFAEASIIAYDASMSVIVQSAGYPNGEDVVQFGGVTSPANDIAYVQVVVGDIAGGSLSDQLALTNVVYGTLAGGGDDQVYCEVTTLEDGVKVTTIYDPDGNPVAALPEDAEPCPKEPIEIIDHEWIRVGICSNDVSFTQQVHYINGDIQAPVLYFDMLGEEVPAPAEFTYGFCDTSPYDVETQPICIDGTSNGVVKIYTDPDSQTLVGYEFCDEDGDISPAPLAWEFGNCIDAVEQIFCKKWKTLAVGLDNTKTRFSWNSVIQLTNSDGSTSTFNQTATGGWTAQINQWATEIQAIYPDCIVEPRCNIAGGCGGLLGPVSDAPLPAMFARYVHISCCPSGVYPISAKILSGTGAGRDLIVDFNVTPEKRGYVCVTCDGGEGELKFEDGTTVPAADLPACTISCSEEFPLTPQSNYQILDGCDDGTDPSTAVVALYDVSTQSISYYIVDADGALEDYTLVGSFVNCDTGESAVPKDCDDAVLTKPCSDFVDECFCASGTVNSGRGGIGDPRNGPFSYNNISGQTWDEFVLAMSNAGYSVELSVIYNVQGLPFADIRRVEICGPECVGDLTYDSSLFPPSVSVALDCSGTKSLRTSLSDCTINALATALEPTDCDACQSDVETDTVCNDVEQVVDGVTIPAGQPIIRKVITSYEKVGCSCIEIGKVTTYFNFQDPVQEFSVVPAFVGTCNSETQTITRCDRNGNEIQVVTLTVFTDDGGLVVTSYADENGQPVPEPLLPLSICNPDVEPIKACIVNDAGETVYGTLHVQYDTAGNPGYDVSTFTSNDGQSQTLGATKFTLNCEATCAECTEVETEYCYDVSGFAFTCTTSTLDINDETVDLCGEGATSGGVFVTDGNICATGGVRSENDAVRHPFATNNTGAGYDPTAIAGDALGVAAQIVSDGCIGGTPQTGNQTVKTLISADAFGLSGAAPTITLSGDWNVGSGIAVGVYDCATNTILPFAPAETQTPSTYDQTNFGVEVFNGGTGAWGGQTGPKSWQVDTSSVADLSTLIIYTVVINPPGDNLCNLAVNGVTAAPASCDVTDVTTLVSILGDTTGTPWTVNGDIICTVTRDVLGPLTCGEASADPIIETTEQIVKSQRVQIDECSMTRLEAKFDTMIGLLMQIVGDPDAPCPCDDEETVTARACVSLFHSAEMLDIGDVTSYQISVDGVVQNTVIHDHTTTYIAPNRSTMYDPVIAAINALPNWSIALISETGPIIDERQLWDVSFTGTGPETMEIEYNGDTIRFFVDASGTIYTQAFDSGSPPASNTDAADFNTPIFSECP